MNLYDEIYFGSKRRYFESRFDFSNIYINRITILFIIDYVKKSHRYCDARKRER